MGSIPQLRDHLTATRHAGRCDYALCRKLLCRLADTDGTAFFCRWEGNPQMILATSYPLLEVFWTILIFFGFVVWLTLLFNVLSDIFRRHDISGFTKVLWIILVVVLPFLGVFIYLIAEHAGIEERVLKRQEAVQAQADEYVRAVAAKSDPTEQIAKAKQLLDSGSITQADYDQFKQKVLSAT